MAQEWKSCCWNTITLTSACYILLLRTKKACLFLKPVPFTDCSAPWQVVCMSFFDIVLDFILMDAFEDLENPPSSVLAVLRNRWLSDSFKETVREMGSAAVSVRSVPRPEKSITSSFPVELNSLFINATLSWSSKQQSSCAWKLFTGKLSLFWKHLAGNQTYGSRGLYQWCHGDVKRWQHLFSWMRIKGSKYREKYVGFSTWPFILAVPQQTLKFKLQSFPLVLPPAVFLRLISLIDWG